MTHIAPGVITGLLVSIHTALAGGDQWGANVEQLRRVSIHTALAGGDYIGVGWRDDPYGFNPHRPCGR